MCSRSWIQVPVLDMRDRGLSFASSVISLASFSSIWGGSEEMLMVLVSVKVHEVWRLSEMRWSSLGRGEKLAGIKGVGFFLLGGLGGVIREENLDRSGFGILGVVRGMVSKEVVG